MSKLHEIREVYLEDINRKQKMSKGIIAESLGEMNKMGEEMSKLKKEELLEWLCYWRDETVGKTVSPPRFEEGQGHQAYQQIKEMIQNLP